MKFMGKGVGDKLVRKIDEFVSELVPNFWV